MGEISYFKKLKMMISYFNIIRDNRDKIINNGDNEFKLRIDRVGRIYTVVNVPEETEVYGVDIAKNRLTAFINKIDILFIEIGLPEMVGIRDIKEVDDFNYLIIFGFSHINTVKFFRNFLIITPIVLVSFLIFFFWLVF